VFVQEEPNFVRLSKPKILLCKRILSNYKISSQEIVFLVPNFFKSSTGDIFTMTRFDVMIICSGSDSFARADGVLSFQYKSVVFATRRTDFLFASIIKSI
jgi:hypothetical protein